MQSKSAGFAHVFAGARVSIACRSAVYYNDLYRFDPATVTWTALSPTGIPPSRRHMMGFAATPDGKLYVFGGFYFAFIWDNQIYGGNPGRWVRGVYCVCEGQVGRVLLGEPRGSG